MRAAVAREVARGRKEGRDWGRSALGIMASWHHVAPWAVVRTHIGSVGQWALRQARAWQKRPAYTANEGVQHERGAYRGIPRVGMSRTMVVRRRCSMVGVALSSLRHTHAPPSAAIRPRIRALGTGPRCGASDGFGGV